MSVSAAAPPLPMYSDPERLVPMLPSERADTAAAAAAERAGAGGKQLSMFGAGDDSPSFWDLLDVINPLQHIPVVNSIYRELTGDQIGVGARLAGGALFGGPIGLLASAVNCALENETGADAGGHLLAMFRDAPATPPATALAQAEAPKEAPAELAMAAVAPEAPVITVPGMQAPPAPRGAMMFTSDGSVAQPAAAQPGPAQPATAQPVSAHTGHIAGKPMAAGPMPLAAGPAPRFMPVPARNAISVGQNAPPPVSVPISNSGNRSNVPITGRDPLAHGGGNVLAAQKAAAMPGLAGPGLAGHDNAGGKPGGNADWFSAMNQALDKYDRAGSLAARPAPSTVTVQ